MLIPSTHDRTNWPPDYAAVIAWRRTRNKRLKQSPLLRQAFLDIYANDPVKWINEWFITYDPRNAFEDELPVKLPMVLFTRQDDLVKFLMACMNEQANGLIDKSRDMGATWVCCAFSLWLWLFRPGSSIGWGSRKEQLVDKIGDPDSIFEKMRMALRALPHWMLPKGFSFDNHSHHMRLINPENQSTITGEAGDNIGRGGRKTIYFKDESAHYEHPESIEAALGDNTKVQIDISTSNGVGTVYDRKKEAGVEWTVGSKLERSVTRVFTMDWSDHPAKTQEWHDEREKAARDQGLLHLFRQEVDRDPSASLQGIIIKPEWVKAAVDAHVHLQFGDNGGWCAGFDPYDEGGDSHALVMRKGVVMRYANDWSEGDTGEATRHVISEIGFNAPIAVQYDCCGIGAGVKAEANRLWREKILDQHIVFSPWDAGMGPIDPETNVIRGDSNTPLNKDFYANLKAQGWWQLARRFENTYRARTEGVKFNAADLISLDSKLPKLRQLMRELSQPVMKKSGDLRLLVDKKPEGAKSPNMADAMMMCYFPMKTPLVITPEMLAASRIVRR